MEGSNHKLGYMQNLTELEQIVFNLNEENLKLSVQQTMNLFDANFPYSFNLAICNAYSAAFSSLRGELISYLRYLKTIQTKKEEINIDNTKIIDIFC